MSLVVVFALTKLREQHRGATSEGKLPFTCFSIPKQHADLLLCTQSDRRRYLPTEHLQEILQGLVKAALRRDSSVLLRGNIYGALLNYLQFTRPPPQSLVAHDNSMVRKPARHECLLCSSPSANSRTFAVHCRSNRIRSCSRGNRSWTSVILLSWRAPVFV